ncbi:MAG: MobC family plasmid mobilization relaxosome protein [Bacteroidales bacterium]|nr:MobC family plasmid mobilization relaxosome protein [Bacteroidales bacterium]
MKRKKSGRPKITDGLKKEKNLCVRVDDDQLSIIRTKAESANKRVSDFVREAALESEVKAGITPEHMKGIRGIINTGNNLNQLAKKAHEAGYTDDVHIECQELAVELRLVINSLKANL